MILRRTHDKSRYDFLSLDCLGRRCFAPGNYEHRGATLSGSRNTGRYSACCMNRAYHGCPHPLPDVDKAMATQRKKDGWKKS